MSNLVKPLPKPVKRERVRKRMNKLGPVGRRRLAANKARKEAFSDAPWFNTCEIAPILRNRGITFTRCLGDLENCHARKVHQRRKDAPIGSPEHEETFARGCSSHHQNYLDLLPPEQTAEIVRLAIELRKQR